MYFRPNVKDLHSNFLGFIGIKLEVPYRTTAIFFLFWWICEFPTKFLIPLILAFFPTPPKFHNRPLYACDVTWRQLNDYSCIFYYSESMYLNFIWHKEDWYLVKRKVYLKESNIEGPLRVNMQSHSRKVKNLHSLCNKKAMTAPLLSNLLM